MDRDYSLIPFISKEAGESVEAGMRMTHFWNSSEADALLADDFYGAHMYNKHYGEGWSLTGFDQRKVGPVAAAFAAARQCASNSRSGPRPPRRRIQGE